MASLTLEDKLEIIRKNIKTFRDFPKKGVLFRDIFSCIAVGPVCQLLRSVLTEYVRDNFPDIEAVVGLEARGFLFCFSIASDLGIGCIPIRKKGKLPGELLSCDYELEYGKDTLEVQTNSMGKRGLKCLIVDDLLATGGTMAAAIQLLQHAGCQVMGCLAVMELVALRGRRKIPEGMDFHSLIIY